MAILALDLGTHLGWALARADGRLDFGGETFPSERGREGLRFQAFRNWLHETKRAADNRGDPLTTIPYERVAGGKWLSAAALEVSFGFRAVFQSWAEHHRIPYPAFTPQQIKFRLTGSKAADKGVMIAAIRARGHDVTDHNAADAIAILYAAGALK